MILPGNNQIVLCGASLMQIVQKHINESTYSDTPKVRITDVRVDVSNGGNSYAFTITTDPEK